MNLLNRQLFSNRRQNVVPDLYFENFSSGNPYVSQVAWVTCQFSSDISTDHLLALGDQDGKIFIVDVRHASPSNDDFVKKLIKADKGCVLELAFVPSRPHNLISISGHSNVALWDIEKSARVNPFKGHEGSVRALSVSQFNPDLFVTGARDGVICEWDQRVMPDNRNIRSSVNVIRNAHELIDSHRTSSGRHRQKQSTRISTETLNGITSLIHLNENVIASASTSFQAGIRLWDMRYRNKNRPMRVLEVPQTRNSYRFGVASLCVDRFNSSLFAACTDSSVYEYAVHSTKKLPVAALSGAPKLKYNTFDVRLAASPISDHLLYGPGENYGLLWDLQKQRTNFCLECDLTTSHFLYPKYTFGGHQAEVRVVRFSKSGQYVVSLDDIQWRLWKSSIHPTDLSTLPVGFERFEPYQLPETALDSLRMTQLSVGSSDGSQKIRKRKMDSSFVSPTQLTFPHEKFSPAAKLLKSISSPLKPITNVVTGLARRRLQFTDDTETAEEETVESKKNSHFKCHFHSKYPTMNLPDFVRERERLKAKENRGPKPECSTIKKRARKGTLEDFITPGQPVSNCSRIVKALERKINLSPRKLVLKRRLKESAKKAAESYTPITPHRGSKAENKAVAVDVQTTPIKRQSTAVGKRKKRSGSVRTLNDFFSQKSD